MPVLRLCGAVKFFVDLPLATNRLTGTLMGVGLSNDPLESEVRGCLGAGAVSDSTRTTPPRPEVLVVIDSSGLRRPLALPRHECLERRHGRPIANDVWNFWMRPPAGVGSRGRA